MKKNEKTIEELCKQDLKKLAKKYSKTEEELADFKKSADSFDNILKKALSEKEVQDIIKNNICFAVIGGINKKTGVKSLIFKFGSREEIKSDLMETVFQNALGEKLEDLIGKLKTDSDEIKKLVNKDVEVVGRA